MNRLHVACGVAFAALTALAFWDHARQRAQEHVPPRVAPAAAGTGGPHARPTPAPEPEAMDREAIVAHLQQTVVAPLRQRALLLESFSRVILPTPDVRLEIEEDEAPPPREDGRAIVLFTVAEFRRTLEGQERRKALARGRIDARSGEIELATRQEGGAFGGFQPLAQGMRTLGVDSSASPPKPAAPVAVDPTQQRAPGVSQGK